MAHPVLEPPHGLLFWSVLFREDLVLAQELRDWLERELSRVLIYQSEYCPQESYYQKEMGAPLRRWMAVSMEPVPRGSLLKAKARAYELELLTAQKTGQRSLNIDPGLLCLEQVLLSTYKPYAHRIFLAEGVFAELCLHFVGSSYQPLPWTYPDYADAQLIEFFHFLRSFLKREKIAWKNP